MFAQLRTALADYVGEGTLEKADRVTPQSRLAPDPETVSVNLRELVPVTTGDALVKDQKAALPNLIKIDVEGSEHEVTAGPKHCPNASRLSGNIVRGSFCPACTTRKTQCG